MFTLTPNIFKTSLRRVMFKTLLSVMEIIRKAIWNMFRVEGACKRAVKILNKIDGF